MPWVKLSDNFAEDPRLDEAGPLALALHVAALCYCGRLLTDGLIPARTVRRLLDLHDLDDNDAVAKRLVEVGLWAATDDGFAIVGYLVDQPSREHVERTRQARAAAGKAGGRASGAVRRSKGQANGKQLASPSLEPRPGLEGRGRAGSRPRPAPGPTCSNGYRHAIDGTCCPEHAEAAS